jgi:hypothetical protein
VTGPAGHDTGIVATCTSTPKPSSSPRRPLARARSRRASGTVDRARWMAFRPEARDLLFATEQKRSGLQTAEQPHVGIITGHAGAA